MRTCILWDKTEGKKTIRSRCDPFEMRDNKV